MRQSYGSAVIAVVFLAGCGPSQPTGDVVPTAPAAGTLTFQGQPLPYYQVTLMPLGERPAVGITDDQGKFVLGTNEPEDGSVVGTHPVAVHYVGPPSNDPEEGITVFTEPPPPPVDLPKKYALAETSGITIDIPPDGDTDLKIDLQ